MQQTQSSIIFNLETCLSSLDEFKSNIPSFTSVFWSLPTSNRKFLAFLLLNAALRSLVSICVCLLLVQTADSRFTVTETQKRSKELRRIEESYDYSVCVSCSCFRILVSCHFKIFIELALTAVINVVTPFSRMYIYFYFKFGTLHPALNGSLISPVCSISKRIPGSCPANERPVF